LEEKLSNLRPKILGHKTENTIKDLGSDEANDIPGNTFGLTAASPPTLQVSVTAVIGPVHVHLMEPPDVIVITEK
jgi:hypothetical protein